MMERSEYGRQATHEEVGKWFERSAAKRFLSIRNKKNPQKLKKIFYCGEIWKLIWHGNDPLQKNLETSHNQNLLYLSSFFVIYLRITEQRILSKRNYCFPQERVHILSRNKFKNKRNETYEEVLSIGDNVLSFYHV